SRRVVAHNPEHGVPGGVAPENVCERSQFAIAVIEVRTVCIDERRHCSIAPLLMFQSRRRGLERRWRVWQAKWQGNADKRGWRFRCIRLKCDSSPLPSSEISAFPL